MQSQQIFQNDDSCKPCSYLVFYQWGFKVQVNIFSGKLSALPYKPAQRVIKEMIYGIQAPKDVNIYKVARSLQEDIVLIKTAECLCRNLSGEDFSDHINTRIIRFGDDKIIDEMVIAIDPGDRMKQAISAHPKNKGSRQ